MEKRRGFLWKSMVFLATACGQAVIENSKVQRASKPDDDDKKPKPPVNNDGAGDDSTKTPDEGGDETPSTNSGVLKGVSIGIDVGHGITDKGNRDPGAQANGIEENAQNRKVANALAKELRNMGATVEIFDYPPGAPQRSLSEKGRAAANGKDYVISCHHNAAGSTSAQYTVMLYGNNAKPASKRLAEAVSDAFDKEMIQTKAIPGITNSRAMAQALGVMSGARDGCKACILLEPYFITHTAMNQALADKLTPKVAKAVATGVANYHTKSKTAFYSALYSVQDFLAPKEWPYTPDPLYADH